MEVEVSGAIRSLTTMRPHDFAVRYLVLLIVVAAVTPCTFAQGVRTPGESTEPPRATSTNSRGEPESIVGSTLPPTGHATRFKQYGTTDFNAQRVQHGSTGSHGSGSRPAV